MLTNSWNYGNVLNQNGEILIGQAGSNPVASFLTSSGHTLSYTFGPGSINIEVNIGNSFFNPVQVSNGGTGRTILTTFGVLIGEGSNNVNVTTAGTSGQILIASTTGDPKFSTITSSGSTVTFTFGPNSLNIEVNVTSSTFFNPLQVPNGGTGRTILTTFGVLIGEGSNRVNVTAAGTSGQILIASTTGDPKFSTVTSSGGTVTFTAGPNSLNVEVIASVLSFVNPWNVPMGGTGRTVLTTFGVLIGEGSNNVNVTAAGTSGQILIASTTGDPKFSTVTSSGSTLAVTVGPNSLNVDIRAPVTVPFGGSGRSVLTTFGVLIGEGSNNVNVTAAGSSGQILIASTTGDPKFSTITSSGGTVTFTVGPNSLNVEVIASSLSFVNPWNVPLGGTGRTVLTTFGVLIGEGSNNVNVTAAGTSGQLLIASTTGDPKFSTITSSGGTVTFTVGPNSLNVEVNASTLSFVNPWNVPMGGTGRTVLTTFGVLIGEGSNNVNVTAAGTSGQILIASTTGDPKFSTITSSGGTVTFTVGPNSLNVEVIASSLSFVNPWNVPLGGTGRSVLTTFGVLIGEGSNNVNVTAAGTSGQILIASTTGDPKFSTVTSSGSTLAVTVGPNSLNVDISAPVKVPFGGSGRSVLTTFGVLIGEGSNNVNVTAAGTSGQILIASTTGDPKFSTITSSGGTVTFTVGPNSLNIEVNVTSSTFFNPLQVANGGTGRTILTTFGVLIGEGSNRVNVTAAGTSGQILIASTTGDPKFSTVTSSGGTVTFTVGPNSLNVEVIASVLSFVNPWNVPMGGTGRTVLTTFGVLIGEGSNNVNITAAGTSGQILIASTTGDPKFSTVTSSGGTVTFTVGPNSLNVEVNASVLSFVNPWNVPMGGTGRSVLTTFGVLIGEGSNNVNVTAAGTSGQILIASTTGDPKFSTVTSSGGTVTFTVGPNSLN
ncbi:MAG: hypothetical protein Q8L68_01745, partial [Methylococcales bacterium]|nr:hypothetical protein [Methylococcales bacterium]